MDKQKKLVVWVLSAIALLVLPLLLQSMGNFWVRIADTALLYVLLALGLNIVVGYAGLLDRASSPSSPSAPTCTA